MLRAKARADSKESALLLFCLTFRSVAEESACRSGLTSRMDNVYTFPMDVLYRYEGLDFVWNAQKAASNFGKHGIRFEQACEVFVDPLVRLLDAGVEDEARDAVIGVTEWGRLLFVVHIERENEAIRIISARPAEAREKKDYEDHA